LSVEKAIRGFFNIVIRKHGFQITPIFNGLQPSKMTVHPCTVRSLPKNRVFQQAAIWQACTVETLCAGFRAPTPQQREALLAAVPGCTATTFPASPVVLCCNVVRRQWCLRAG
jgi:hypothetical protein